MRTLPSTHHRFTRTTLLAILTLLIISCDESEQTSAAGDSSGAGADAANAADMSDIGSIGDLSGGDDLESQLDTSSPDLTQSNDDGAVDSTDTRTPTYGPQVLADDQVADYSCLGMPAPDQSWQLDSVSLIDFVGSVAVGYGMEVFTDNVVTPSCGEGCVSYVTGDDGQGAPSLSPEGPVSYRVAVDPSDTVRAPTVAHNVSASLELFVVDVSIFHLVFDQPESVHLATLVNDCAGMAVEHVRLELFQDGTRLDERLDFYLDNSGSLLLDATRTANAGWYRASGLDEGNLRVEAWGSVGGGEPELLLGCAVIDTVAATTNLLVLPPLSDVVPAECGRP